MRAITFAVAASVLASVTPSLQAELDGIDLWAWQGRAKNCGEAFQAYVAVGVDFLIPNFLENMLGSARWDGANEEQIELINQSFVDGRKIAFKDGYSKDNFGEPSQDTIGYYKKDLEFYAPECRQEGHPKGFD